MLKFRRLKALFQEYRPVLRFILLFLGSYLLLTLLYQGYLNWSVGGSYPPDYVTNLVARQTTQLLTDFGYDAKVIPYPGIASMVLEVNGKPIAQIVEGCNSISVIILFVSFIIAFAQGFKKTFFFLLAGAAMIYVVNLFRIAFLTLALNKYPEQEELLHNIVFPGIIYGMVFLLWVVWVRMINNKKEESHD
nr:exosortase family protein XrtF [Aureitalea marina]